jgi:hypothetical protein
LCTTGFAWHFGHVLGQGATTVRHAGGNVRRRPNRGGDATATLPTAVCFCGLRAATFSGSQINKSEGVHSSTEQMISKSSSRIVVGVLVHNADILPALISSPASASRRRSSVDFPDAAFGRLHA